MKICKKKVSLFYLMSTLIVLSIIIVGIIFVTNAFGAEESVFAVNCGGSAYTSSDGIAYAADTGYTGGSTYTNTASISGTTDDTLYQSERYGNCSYAATVPNGNYLVTLYFAETYHTAAGSRSFNVIMEGNEVISDLDIYAEAGGNAAYITETYVTVNDGQINIEFATNVENAKINAINVATAGLSANFSYSPTVVLPDQVITFDASASRDSDGTIENYSWNFGDGGSGSGETVSHTYSATGNYQVTLTVTDNDGNTDSVTKTISVNDEVNLSNVEDSGYDLQVGSPSGSNGGSSTVLPDPFTMWDGSQVKTMADWRYRRRELVVEVEKRILGEKAPPPSKIGGTVTGSVSSSSYTVNVQNPGGSASFSNSISLPSTGSAPYPAVIVIGGFNSLNTDVLNSEGVATINYDAYAIASESSGDFSTGKYYDANPSYKGNTGALVAWAWGVSRIIDMLEKNPDIIDPTKIAIHGCSRFGKAAFVIGAFDERIALGLPTEPGTGGPAPLRSLSSVSPSGQPLSSCIGEASWFGPMASSYSSSMAVDMDDVATMYAPRGLLLMDNPHIDWLSYQANYLGCAAAYEVYKAMGKSDAMWYLGNTDNGNHCAVRSEYGDELRAMIRKFLKGDNSVTTGGLNTHANHGNINVAGWTSSWNKGTISQ